MSKEMKNLSHFELRLVMGESLDCFAGNTAAEAAEGRYRTRGNAPRSLFEEILEKLSTSIHSQTDHITLNISNDKWILKDPDLP